MSGGRRELVRFEGLCEPAHLHWRLQQGHSDERGLASHTGDEERTPECLNEYLIFIPLILGKHALAIVLLQPATKCARACSNPWKTENSSLFSGRFHRLLSSVWSCSKPAAWTQSFAKIQHTTPSWAATDRQNSAWCSVDYPKRRRGESAAQHLTWH